MLQSRWNGPRGDEAAVAAGGDAAHESFLNGDSFRTLCDELQDSQQQQRELLVSDSARVRALCPADYDAILKLSVELMTAFSRLSAPPDGEQPVNIRRSSVDPRPASTSGLI